MDDEMIYRSAPHEMRADTEDNSKRTLHGHFSTFDDFYEINSFWEGRFLEKVAPGAFEQSFRDETPKVLFEHGMDPTVANKPLGKVISLSEDKRGAAYEVELLNTSYNADIVEGLDAGLYGASFGFRVEEESWDHEPKKSSANPDGLPERTITRATVHEFSVVLFPANDKASAAVRSLTDHIRPAKESPQETETPELTHDEEETENRDGSPDEVSGERVDTVEPDEVRAPNEVIEANTITERTDGMSTEKLSVEQRRARIDEIKARMTELSTEYDGQIMPDETDREFNEIYEERQAHEKAILDTEKRRKMVEETALRGQTERTTGAPNVILQKNIYDVGEIRASSRSDVEYTQRLRDSALRAVEKDMRFDGAFGTREDNQTHVEALLRGNGGSQVDTKALAERVLVTNSPEYRKAFIKWVSVGDRGLNPQEHRAMALGVDVDGGYAVPVEIDPTVNLTSDGAVNPLRQISRVERISGTELRLLNSDGVDIQYATTPGDTNENVESTETTLELDPVVVNTSRADAYVRWSIEISDAWSAVERTLMNAILDKRAETEAEVLVTGAIGGAPVTHYEGISADLDAASHVDGTVLDLDALFELHSALPPRHEPRARFVANKRTYNQLRALAEGSDGADLWVRLGVGRPSELMGFPAHELSTMPDSTSNDPYLILGDFSKFVIADRIGMTIDRYNFGFGTTTPAGQRSLAVYWWTGSAIHDHNAFRGLAVPTGP